jgi:hypothetical protein
MPNPANDLQRVLRLVTITQVYQIPQSAMNGPELQSVVASVVQCIGDHSEVAWVTAVMLSACK